MPPKSTLISQPVAPATYQQTYLNRSLFDEAIANHGYQCAIERACKCPCKTMNAGAVMSDCLNCGGTGWFWINKQTTQILCSSMANRNKYEPWTAENMGTVNISCRPQDKLGFMDKVTLLELESWFSEVKNVRQSNNLSTWFTFVTYEPLRVFEMYMYVDSDHPLKYMELNIDYTISRNKIIIIPQNGQNLTGKTITLRYVHNPVYYVQDINRDLVRQKQMINCSKDAENKTNMPLSCVARRAHYVLDVIDFGGEALFDNTKYDKTPPNYDY